MTVQTLRYVPYSRVAAYEALGWVRVPVRRAVHHDAYSVLLEWAGEGEPREPVEVTQ